MIPDQKSQSVAQNPDRKSGRRSLRVALYLLFSLIGISVVVLAYSLEPDPAGHGTHTQLGIPACGFFTVTGYPCPSCGLTTSFSHMARGNLSDGIATQPFGAFLFLCTAFGSLFLIFAAIHDIRIGRWMYTAWFDHAMWLLFLFFLLSWVYKIAITV